MTLSSLYFLLSFAYYYFSPIKSWARGWITSRVRGWITSWARGWMTSRARGWITSWVSGWITSRARGWITYRASGRIIQLDLGIETRYRISFIIRILSTVKYLCIDVSVNYCFSVLLLYSVLRWLNVFYILLIAQPCREVVPFHRYWLDSEGECFMGIWSKKWQEGFLWGTGRSGNYELT